VAKKHKSRHRVPPQAYELHSDPISERYQIEVDYATNRLQRRYDAKVSRLAELRRQLDMREYELGEIMKLMQPGNRTKVPWRPVPITHTAPG